MRGPPTKLGTAGIEAWDLGGHARRRIEPGNETSLLALLAEMLDLALCLCQEGIMYGTYDQTVECARMSTLFGRTPQVVPK